MISVVTSAPNGAPVPRIFPPVVLNVNPASSTVPALSTVPAPSVITSPGVPVEPTAPMVAAPFMIVPVERKDPVISVEPLATV